MMSREVHHGAFTKGRVLQNVRFRDRIGRQRRKQSKHSATPSRGDCPRFLVIDNTVYPGNDDHDIELIDSSDNRGAGVSVKNQITDPDAKPIVTNGTPVIVIPVLPPPKK